MINLAMFEEEGVIVVLSTTIKVGLWVNKSRDGCGGDMLL